MPLTHYVVVRRDLQVGVLLAMVAHAAGESFYKLASHTWTTPWGSAPTIVQPDETIAVVLGARNEGRLVKLEAALMAAAITHAAIRETEGPCAGQLMAIGLMPGPKEALSPFVNDFHMLRELQP